MSSKSNLFESEEVICSQCGDWEEAAFNNDGSRMSLCVICAFH